MIGLAEVQLFNNDIQLSTDSLTFTLSSTGGYCNCPASSCNDGSLDTDCHSLQNDDRDPTLTIVSTAAFDKVVVYNRKGNRERIEGATITVTVNGQSHANTFPNSPDAVFTFLFSSSGLQMYVPSAVPSS